MKSIALSRSAGAILLAFALAAAAAAQTSVAPKETNAPWKPVDAKRWTSTEAGSRSATRWN